MSSSRNAVYAAINGERDYQDSKWNENTTTTKGIHSVSEWILYMESYLEEARTQVSRNPDPEASELALNTIRKIAGMAVCCMEQHGAPLRKKEFNILDDLQKGVIGRNEARARIGLKPIEEVLENKENKNGVITCKVADSANARTEYVKGTDVRYRAGKTEILQVITTEDIDTARWFTREHAEEWVPLMQAKYPKCIFSTQKV